MSQLLMHLEQNYQTLSIAVEQTSLEDAYLKIAKLDNQGTDKDEIGNDYEEKVARYLEVEGRFSCCRQL